MSALLQVQDLRFAYPRQPVLHGVSMELAAGEVVALLGPNGSGKSTVIRLLLGELRGQGRIEWAGKSLRAWRRRDLAREVAYLPQTPAYEPGQRVSEALRLGRAPYWSGFGIESQHDVDVVEQTAKHMGLEELLDRSMDEISGGQRQMVFVGRALVQEPRALLLDEPNTFLDLRHQVELCRLLRSTARQRSIGVLMASHDLNMATAFADRLILLHQGTVAAAGVPEAVLRPEILSRVYEVHIERVERGPNKPPAVLPVADP
jgi:iron complex transport system ATP-binding protein